MGLLFGQSRPAATLHFELTDNMISVIRLQPHTDPDCPDDEHEAMEVVDHKFVRNSVKFKIKFESRSGTYTSYEQWAELEDAMADCVDDGEFQGSILVKCAVSNPDNSLFEMLAEAGGVSDVKSLFADYKEDTVEVECSNDHANFDGFGYEDVKFGCYFGVGKSLWGQNAGSAKRT